MINEEENEKNKLEKILNITPAELSKQLKLVEPGTSYEDIELAKFNIKEVIMKGNDALDTLIDVARGTDQPRAYEVLATLIRTLVDANKELVAVNIAERNKIQNSDNRKINNNIFLGSTAELLKILKPHEVKEVIIDHEDDTEED